MRHATRRYGPRQYTLAPPLPGRALVLRPRPRQRAGLHAAGGARLADAHVGLRLADLEPAPGLGALPRQPLGGPAAPATRAAALVADAARPALAPLPAERALHRDRLHASPDAPGSALALLVRRRDARHPRLD